MEKDGVRGGESCRRMSELTPRRVYDSSESYTGPLLGREGRYDAGEEKRVGDEFGKVMEQTCGFECMVEKIRTHPKSLS